MCVRYRGSSLRRDNIYAITRSEAGANHWRDKNHDAREHRELPSLFSRSARKQRSLIFEARTNRMNPDDPPVSPANAIASVQRRMQRDHPRRA